MEEQLLSLRNKLSGIISKGLNSEVSIPINELQILITNKCNLYCTMCHACFPEYSNHTYNNEPPFEMSLEQYKKVLNASPVEKLKSMVIKSNTIKAKAPKGIVFSSAESLLNRDIYKIIRYTKRVFPDTTIRIISNGTIPLKKNDRDIIQYINQIGFSVDGCTAETFEKIRTPAKFDHVIRNIKGYIEANKEFGNKTNIVLAMTLSALNAHELPGIVELAGELGGVESLWVQPMIITHESLSHLKQYVFTEIPRNTLAQYINAAYEVSKRNGVRVDMMGSISDYAFSDESPDKPDIDYAPYTPACNYLWNGNLQVDESGMIRRVCCYLSKEGNNEIINKYGLLKNY